MRTHLKLTSHRRRSPLAIASTLTAALLISLAAPASHAVPTHAASTTPITVWDIQTGTQQKALLAEAAAFNKTHPDTPVQYTFQPPTYPTVLSVAMGAHHGPDIFMGWGGGILKGYIDAGDVVDLTSALNADPAWKSRYIPSILNGAAFNGHYYGVPYNESQPEVIVYNKAVFAKYGLTVPTTWPQLLNVVSTLKSHNVIPFTLGGADKWPEMMIMQYLAERIGGPSAFNDISQRKPGASLNTPVGVKAATMAQDLVTRGAFQPGFSGFNWGSGQDSDQVLWAGRAAMMFMGVWLFGMSDDSAPQFAKTMGFFPVPTVPGGKGKVTDLIGNPANFYSVSTTAKNPAAAIAYLKTTLNPTFSAALLANGEIPPVATLGSSNIKDPLVQQQVHMLLTSTNFQLSGDQLLPSEPAQDFLTAISSLFAQSITPQQFASQLQSKTAAYFATHH
jgi:raffinose/stachyose/melibiose transport system substrate-binding protein